MAGGMCCRGVRGRGCAWWGGGVCVDRGACMAGGHVWRGVHAWQGACVVGGVHGRVVCMAGGMHGRGGMHGGGHVWQIPRHTVNEQVVCILLECILVVSV